MQRYLWCSVLPESKRKVTHELAIVQDFVLGESEDTALRRANIFRVLDLSAGILFSRIYRSADEAYNDILSWGGILLVIEDNIYESYYQLKGEDEDGLDC